MEITCPVCHPQSLVRINKLPAQIAYFNRPNLMGFWLVQGKSSICFLQPETRCRISSGSPGHFPLVEPHGVLVWFTTNLLFAPSKQRHAAGTHQDKSEPCPHALTMPCPLLMPMPCPCPALPMPCPCPDLALPSSFPFFVFLNKITWCKQKNRRR